MSLRTHIRRAAILWVALQTASAVMAAEIKGRLLPAQLPLGDRLTVFGDSYSDINSVTYPFPKWSQQTLDAGYVKWLRSFARGGSTANDLGRDGRTGFTFKGQVDRYEAKQGLQRKNDVMAIHLGQIDAIRHRYPESTDLTRAKADYKRQLDRLIRLGATGENRRIFLFLAPDRGFNRSDAAIVRRRTVQWNHWLSALAANRRQVGVVDLFTVIDRVRANPALYGLTDISKPDPAHHADSALLYDNSHFGKRGHEIIASVFAKALAAPTDTAAAIGTAREAVGAWHELASDALARPDAAEMHEGHRQFTMLRLGEARDGDDEGRIAGSPRQTGAGFVWAPTPSMLLGLAVGDVAKQSTTSAATWRSTAVAAAKGASLLVSRHLDDIRFSFALSAVDMDVDRSQFDTLIDHGSSAKVGGRAIVTSATASRAIRLGSVTLGPAAGLSWQRLEVDSHKLDNAYDNGTAYDDMLIDDAALRIGITAATEPLDLGGLGLLNLGGSWQFTRGLIGSAYEVRTSSNGVSERETIARPKLSAHRLELAGTLAPMPGMRLTARAGALLDDTGETWTAGVGLSLEF